jgi:hypothetical protein
VFCAGGEEIWVGRVGGEAWVDVGEGFEGWVFLTVVPGWEVLRVLKELVVEQISKASRNHTFASVLPPSTSICRLTFGASFVARLSFSSETEGTSIGSS